MARLRLGIIGVGRHGTRYAHHAARDIDGLALSAVCRRNTAEGTKVANQYGCAYVQDPRELIHRSDVDAVAIVTVPVVLEELINECLSVGKPILVEKPVAPDLETGRRIASALTRAAVPCMAGHTLRFNNVVLEMRRLVPELGRIDSVVLTQRFPPQFQLDWIDDPARAGGGNILHTGVHCFDLIRFVTGLEPDTVTCETRSMCTQKTEDNFGAVITLRDSGAIAVVTCSRSTHSRNGTIEISGAHGQLLGDHVNNVLARIGANGRQQLGSPAAAQTVKETLESFASAVRSGTQPTPSYADGLTAVAVAEACYESARSGRRTPVVLPHVGK